MKTIVFAAVMAMALGAFADYGKDMSATYQSCTAVDWQNKNNAPLAEATKPEVLEGFVKDEASAKALLASVEGAYTSDPMKLMQIAAVTQFVMVDDECWCKKVFLFWQQTRAEQRKIWATALLDLAKGSKDSYVTVFMLDQLRWCGCPCQAPAVSVLRASQDKAVADMATIVATELARAK